MTIGIARRRMDLAGARHGIVRIEHTRKQSRDSSHRGTPVMLPPSGANKPRPIHRQQDINQRKTPTVSGEG
jgi:hypothetical protein